jgi:DNA-binding IscR family transcriptional regulator
MFRGPFTLEKCIFIQKMCPERNTCILRKELEGIESYVTSRLRSITIDYLMNPDQKKD